MIKKKLHLTSNLAAQAHYCLIQNKESISQTHIFYKLYVGKHKKLIEDGVEAAVSCFGVPYKAIQLFFDLMGLGQHPLREVLQVEKKLSR